MAEARPPLPTLRSPFLPPYSSCGEQHPCFSGMWITTIPVPAPGPLSGRRRRRLTHGREERGVKPPPRQGPGASYVGRPLVQTPSSTQPWSPTPCQFVFYYPRVPCDPSRLGLVSVTLSEGRGSEVSSESLVTTVHLSPHTQGPRVPYVLDTQTAVWSSRTLDGWRDDQRPSGTT